MRRKCPATAASDSGPDVVRELTAGWKVCVRTVVRRHDDVVPRRRPEKAGLRTAGGPSVDEILGGTEQDVLRSRLEESDLASGHAADARDRRAQHDPAP